MSENKHINSEGLKGTSWIETDGSMPSSIFTIIDVKVTKTESTVHYKINGTDKNLYMDLHRFLNQYTQTTVYKGAYEGAIWVNKDSNEDDTLKVTMVKFDDKGNPVLILFRLNHTGYKEMSYADLTTRYELLSETDADTLTEYNHLGTDMANTNYGQTDLKPGSCWEGINGDQYSFIVVISCNDHHVSFLSYSRYSYRFNEEAISWFLKTFKPTGEAFVKARFDCARQDNDSKPKDSKPKDIDYKHYYVTYDIKKPGKQGYSKGSIVISFYSENYFNIIQAESIIKNALDLNKVRYKGIIISNWIEISKEHYTNEYANNYKMISP